VALLPVIVGGILGLTASLSTSYYMFRIERREAIRKDRATHLERAMALAVKYTNDLSKLLAVGMIVRGDTTTQDVAALAAPTDTLMELNAVMMLYFPQLKDDIDHLFVTHGTMMKHFDDIIDVRGQHRTEDANALIERIQKEVSPTAESVRSLMKKLSELARWGRWLHRFVR
jgi:hypothetical protein